MNFNGYIACICEGSAENAIMDLLLDANKLIFTRNQLLEEDIIRIRGAKKFESTYLRKGFDKEITILRILDSRRENFKLSKAYINKISVIDIITAPEIEMLIILKEKKYTDFKKSKMKPSEFCKIYLRLKNVKSYNFVKDYFDNVDELIQSIHEYRRISNIKQGEYTLLDLLQ